jgi:hypothetical protein
LLVGDAFRFLLAIDKVAFLFRNLLVFAQQVLELRTVLVLLFAFLLVLVHFKREQAILPLSEQLR